jgi:cob(I)alamin adenosyltransferase
MKKSNIYTKKGDMGTSCLTDQVRRLKSDTVFELLGQLDELNARISDSLLAFGMIPRNRDDNTIVMLQKVQHTLFDIVFIFKDN